MPGKLKFSAVAMFVVMVMLGCMAKQPMQPINTQSLDAKHYRPKAESLMIVLDASSSMEHLQMSNSKFDIAAALATGLIKTIPEMNMDAGLISFGHSSSISAEEFMVLSPMARFDRNILLKNLGKVTKGGGTSSLHAAIDATAGVFADKKGKKVLIIISDGDDMGERPLKAAQALKKASHDEICIHTIQVGAAGTQMLRQISETTGCGSFRNADDLKSGPQLAAYLKEVLLEKSVDSDGDGVMDDMDQCPNTPAGAIVDARGCPQDDDGDGVPNSMDTCPNTPAGVSVDAKGCPADSDKDGVADYLDKCPGTPAGLKVDRSGCPIPAVAGAEFTDAGTWILNDVQFETGKADLKASSYESLDKVVALLQQNPDVKMEIQGHTDSTGNEGYNYKLSENRANAVKTYLVEKGISSARLIVKGYGPSKPIADNGTVQGKARNRRVEFRTF